MIKMMMMIVMVERDRNWKFGNPNFQVRSQWESVVHAASDTSKLYVTNVYDLENSDFRTFKFGRAPSQDACVRTSKFGRYLFKRNRKLETSKSRTWKVRNPNFLNSRTFWLSVLVMPLMFTCRCDKLLLNTDDADDDDDDDDPTVLPHRKTYCKKND